MSNIYRFTIHNDKKGEEGVSESDFIFGDIVCHGGKKKDKKREYYRVIAKDEFNRISRVQQVLMGKNPSIWLDIYDLPKGMLYTDSWDRSFNLVFRPKDVEVCNYEDTRKTA